MANLIPYPRHRAKDGTTRVFIKLHHQGKKKLIRTEVLLTDADLTKSKKIKSAGLKHEVDEIVRKYQMILHRIGSSRLAQLNVDEVYELLIKGDNFTDEPDFFEYGMKVVDQLKGEGKKGTAANYGSAISSFKEFIKSPTLSFNDVTGKVIREYALYLRNAKSRRYKKSEIKAGHRTLTLYLAIIRAIINRARSEYNDEDLGELVIRVNPFAKFKIPAEEKPEPRALSIEKIRMIRDMEIPIEKRRMALARDCFMLSFYLIGMNSADLFDYPPVKDGRIEYERKKTKSRRSDRALISVKVEPEAAKILERYTFKELYSSPNTFNKALNIGLKEVGSFIDEPDLTFYSARHSWATIASNDCMIDKYTVHLALNHVDEEMKVTDRYIKKDWSQIDKANRKVLEYLK